MVTFNLTPPPLSTISLSLSLNVLQINLTLPSPLSSLLPAQEKEHVSCDRRIGNLGYGGAWERRSDGQGEMSCNGCRVLRKGCSDSCILRTCLQWIENPEAQGYATLFVSKFFGRSDLMSFISAVPENKRPALFQSLLFEACGRTVNPVNGAVGLLWTGNWHVCQAAVDTVLAGGTLRPIHGISAGPIKPAFDEASDAFCADAWKLRDAYSLSKPFMYDNASEEARRIETQPSRLGISAMPRFSNKINGGRGKRSGTSFYSEGSSGTMSYDGSGDDDSNLFGCEERKLLNLFI